jgi:serine/threonine protein kinase
MKFLYENFKIVHRDLKPENILITPDNRVIIIDFGVARTIESTMKGFSSIAGTPAFAAIEVLEEENKNIRNQKADMWSLGCILHFLCTGKEPF